VADYLEIYFDAPGSSADQVDRVAEAIGVSFEPSDQPYADFMGVSGDLGFDFKRGHRLDDDGGIPFERMPFVLTVRGPGRQAGLEEQVARAAFDKLDDLGYRPLYLVLGLEKILAAKDG
jgi:hypothetical protein